MFIAICDDDSYYRETLCELIERWKTENAYQDVFVRTFASAEELLWNMESAASFDLFFIDIRLPGLSGVELAERIRKENENTVMVFISSDNGYLEKGYELGLFRYLLKPLDQNKVKSCLSYSYQRRIENEKSILVRSGDDSRVIKLKSVVYFSREIHAVIAHLEDGTAYRVRYTGSFDSFYEKYCQNSFVRCHRGFIVNMMFVDRFSYKEMYLMDSRYSVPVGRKYHDETLKKLKAFIDF